MHLARLSASATIFLATLGLMATAACSRRQSSDRTQATAQGRAVYLLHCQACHEGTNLQLVKQPPKLVGLFRHSPLPSGAPATDDEVRKTILGGRGIMPPFKDALDKEQVDELLAYLHTL
jgi:mono/diheme cytochrome c family protein